MPREAQLRIGTATRVYAGELRLAVSSVYDDYAVMGLYMSDQTCDWLFPDVGQTMVLVASDSLAYEVTLLSTNPDAEVRLEVRRRAPPNLRPAARARSPAVTGMPSAPASYRRETTYRIWGTSDVAWHRRQFAVVDGA